MKPDLKSISEIFKDNKRSKIIILICIILVLFLFLSELFTHNDKKEKEDEAVYSSSKYTAELENKLENIVSSIDHAGKCKIMITLDTGEENVYARESKNQSEDKTEFSKSSDEYEYVILKNSSSKENGMLLKVVEPNVRGVAIVCEGGDKATVKEDIICAVSSVLDIKSNQISITKMKTN